VRAAARGVACGAPWRAPRALTSLARQRLPLRHRHAVYTPSGPHRDPCGDQRDAIGSDNRFTPVECHGYIYISARVALLRCMRWLYRYSASMGRGGINYKLALYRPTNRTHEPTYLLPVPTGISYVSGKGGTRIDIYFF
jgi:hypothetical protein